MEDDMTLHEAIRKILTEHSGCLMTVEEICRQNENQNLFKRKKDGKSPLPWQVLWRTSSHLGEFEVFVRLRK